MKSGFLIYGSTGFVGSAIARLAVERGLQPILAGRDMGKLEAQAAELRLTYRRFSLVDREALEESLKDVTVVLHCAGPFMHTFEPMAEACLRTGTHYLDLTGELPVYEALAARDADAKMHGVMLLPGVGFDCVPTDCLATHLKQRLPSATHLTLAFQSEGPAGLPPGTQRTAIELIPYGNRVRRDGKLEVPEQAMKTRMIDFGQGPVPATRWLWADVFTAYYSTSIPNIEDYLVFTKATRRQMSVIEYLRPLFKSTAVRGLLMRSVKRGPTADECAQTKTHVWGEVEDDQGQKVVSLLHGPELAVVWTARTALAVVQKVLAGLAPVGFQTPALAYGADFVLECEGVTREDVH